MGVTSIVLAGGKSLRLGRSKALEVIGGRSLIERVVERLYSQPGERPTAAYARDLLEMIIEGAAYDEQEPVLDDESFDRAFKLSMRVHDSGERT